MEEEREGSLIHELLNSVSTCMHYAVVDTMYIESFNFHGLFSKNKLMSALKIGVDRLG